MFREIQNTVAAAVVPEPSTWLLLTSGLAITLAWSTCRSWFQKAKQVLLPGLIVSLGLWSSGCATTQEIGISSIPSGAEVLIDGEVNGSTPGFIAVERSKDHHIIFRKEGYKDERRNTIATLNWGRAIPIFLCCGMWGLDLWGYDQEPPGFLDVQLQPLQTPLAMPSIPVRKELLYNPIEQPQ